VVAGGGAASAAASGAAATVAAQLADKTQMQRESLDVHAQLNAWNEEKQRRRLDRELAS
jgi:hypothetical protein